jgi:hypothetical protein
MVQLAGLIQPGTVIRIDGVRWHVVAVCDDCDDAVCVFRLARIEPLVRWWHRVLRVQTRARAVCVWKTSRIEVEVSNAHANG